MHLVGWRFPVYTHVYIDIFPIHVHLYITSCVSPREGDGGSSVGGGSDVFCTDTRREIPTSDCPCCNSVATVDFEK